MHKMSKTNASFVLCCFGA